MGWRIAGSPFDDDSGVASAPAAFVQDVTEAGTSLANWIQNWGAWTVAAGGLQCDSGTNEAVLMYAKGGAWKQGVQMAHAIEADIGFTAASDALSDAGFLIAGVNSGGGNTSGNIRAYMRRNGQVAAVDVAQAALTITCNPGLTDQGAGTTRRLRVLKCGRDVEVSIGGVLVLSATLQGGGSIWDQAWGMWCNPAHAYFGNIKHWSLAVPS